MGIYVVSVMKKSGKTVGYVTVNTDYDNKVKVLSREDLIACMKYDDNRFENVRYSKSKIRGFNLS